MEEILSYSAWKITWYTKSIQYVSGTLNLLKIN